MDEELEKNHISRRTKIICKIGHVSIGILEWMACFDRYYECIDFFYLMASVLLTFKRNI